MQYREFRVDRRTVYKHINECIPEELRELRRALAKTRKAKKKSKTKFPLKPASQGFSIKDMVNYQTWYTPIQDSTTNIRKRDLVFSTNGCTFFGCILQKWKAKQQLFAENKNILADIAIPKFFTIHCNHIQHFQVTERKSWVLLSFKMLD